ncbi:MAG: DUF1573 domain-containing protein, partial [Gemmataceae bacterium]
KAAVAAIVLGGAGLLGWGLAKVLKAPPGGPVRTLVALPPDRFVDGSVPEEAGVATFTLKNETGRDLTIRGVERSCACVIASDVKGKVLSAGESWPLEVRITVPDRGVESQRLDVVHDGPLSPLSLTVSGRQRVPYFVRSATSQATFFGLASPDASRLFTFTTCESARSAPWGHEVACELPDVTLRRVRVVEHAAGAVAMRTYHYRVGWSRLPASGEFHGKVDLRLGDPPSAPVHIGYVIGSTAGQVK